MGACSHTDELESINMGDGMIKISTSPSSMELVRSADNSLERKVTHIDVFVVKSEGADAGQIVHYERNTSGNNASAEDGAGTISLRVKRSDAKFIADAKYTIYMVANASLSESDAAAKASLEELESWIQSDVMLHVTGTQLGSGDRPAAFLMQAIAGNTSGQVINSSAGNSENLSLAATLERAASKIVVTIKQGEHVEFHRQLSEGENVGNALYYFNMLPTKSYVLPKNTLSFQTKDLVTTVDLGPNERTFVWTQAAGHTAEQPKHEIRLVGYAYAHNWSAATALDETCAIVNIPMKWDKDGNAANGKETSVFNSWYMIPLSKDKKFGRNKCYSVTVTIDTAGADDRTSVVELDDVYFETLPWQEVEISVGETGNDPKYLTLNTNLVQIYNADMDSSQLTFSSSSFIAADGIKVKTVSSGGTMRKSIYYYDKFGQKTYLETINATVASAVKATADKEVLNGVISITSPMLPQTPGGDDSHYNTIRYIDFEVTNEQGLTETFTVMQYPVIYITNVQGYFSYRDDFIAPGATTPTHFLNRSSVNLTSAYWASVKIQRKSGNNWTDVSGSSGNASVAAFIANETTYYADGKKLTAGGNYFSPYYYYEYTEGGTTYRKVYSNLDEIFTSDVVRELYTGKNAGKAKLHSYYYGSGNNWSYSNSKDPGNQRMYHVHVTATSNDYTVARPRIVDDEGNSTSDVENGHTDDSADNARLVSPSFMIASLLGVTSSVSSTSDSMYARAVNQCKNYVATHFEDLNNNNSWDTGEPLHHYRDWRLPTAEEIRIIAELQGKTNGAVDIVLAGEYYFCASPEKYIEGREDGTDGYFVRCIRDAYDE